MNSEELRSRLGPGPSWLVRATIPPSLAVEVGNLHVPLSDGEVIIRSWEGHELRRGVSTTNPRIDLVCIKAELGEVHARAISGHPSPCPVRPATPAEWMPVAEVYVPAHACFVSDGNIKEIRP